MKLQQESSTDFWDKLTPDQQAEIYQGISDIENGDVVDYKSFMEKYR